MGGGIPILKTFLISGIIIFILAVGGFWHNQHMDKSVNIIDGKLATVENQIHSNNWGYASDEIETLKKEWRKIKKTWSVLVDHQEIDNIDVSLARAEQYIKENERGLSLGEISALRLLVNHIAENVKLSIQNIF